MVCLLFEMYNVLDTHAHSIHCSMYSSHRQTALHTPQANYTTYTWVCITASVIWLPCQDNNRLTQWTPANLSNISIINITWTVSAELQIFVNTTLQHLDLIRTSSVGCRLFQKLANMWLANHMNSNRVPCKTTTSINMSYHNLAKVVVRFRIVTYICAWRGCFLH